MMLLLLLTSSFAPALCSKLQSLDGEWTFSNFPKTPDAVIKGKASVPGDIYTDLRSNDLIGDPLFADNDVKLRWVARERWTYSRTFDLAPDVAKSKNHIIVFDGLDTVAKVLLNGVGIIQASNQFIQYYANISSLLVDKPNKLEIRFESPVAYSEGQAAEYRRSHGYTVPPDCVPGIYHGECRANYIRKMQASFSWDWGPAFPTIGIWQPVRIVGFEQIHVKHISISAIPDGGNVLLVLEADLIAEYGKRTLQWSVDIQEIDFHDKGTIELEEGKTAVKIKIVVPGTGIKLWWPNGMGEQKMYEADVKLGSGDDLSSHRMPFGVRSVELVQDHISPSNVSLGRNFYFRINDVPVFLKGSNWIPVSPFPAQNDSERMEFLLESARVTGMNVLRIWGGGRYESDEFYRMADQKGILLWHDLMFACALYPTNDQFMENVKAEVEYQVKRLKWHPSILIWAGNNENELAITDGWYSSLGYSGAQARTDYLKLYARLLAPLVRSIDNTRPFVLSSPSNGVETENAGGIAEKPSSPRWGDIHFYTEFSNLWADSSFLTPRCATEYGVQSLPGRRTMAHYLPDGDFNYFSSNFTHRQHHPGGFEAQLTMIFSHFPLPKVCKDASLCLLQHPNLMDRFVYFSQFHQALAYKTETEHYLRYRGRLDERGLGNTMCALYWQLNDVWAAPTWSSIDWDLRWKPAHYEARRFFAQNVVSMFLNNDDSLEVYVINDRNEELKNAKAVVTVMAWTNGFDAVSSETFVLDLPPQSSTPIELNSIRKWERERGVRTAIEDFVFVGDLFDSSGAQLGYRATVIPDKLYHVNLDATGDVSVTSLKKTSPKTYEMTINATAIAPLTWIEVERDDVIGYWSDNAFTMTHPTRTLTLTLSRPLETDLAPSDISVCALKSC